MNRQILKGEMLKYGLFFYIISGCFLISLGGIGYEGEALFWNLVCLWFFYLTLRSGYYFVVYLKRYVSKQTALPQLPTWLLGTLTKRAFTKREIILYAAFITICYIVGGISWYVDKKYGTSSVNVSYSTEKLK